MAAMPPANASPDAGTPARPAHRAPAAILLFVLVTLAVLGLDLGLKSWSFAHVAGFPVELRGQDPNDVVVPPHEPIVLAPHILNLQLTANPGAIFGLGKGSQGFFIAMSVAAILAIGWVFARSPASAHFLHVALALILAGALGNLYDRICFGLVRDMLHLFPAVPLPLGLKWPGGARDVYPWIFNLADAALVVGVAMLMLMVWLSERHPRTAPAKPG